MEFHLKIFKELEFLTEIRFLENRISKQGHFVGTFGRNGYFAILAGYKVCVVSICGLVLKFILIILFYIYIYLYIYIYRLVELKRL